MNHAESAAQYENNVIDITDRLPLTPDDPYALVEVLHQDREARRQQLVGQGWHPERIKQLLGKEFGPRIARLALKADITSLLEPESTPRPQSMMSSWAKRQRDIYGSDDVRSRQMPPSDRD